MAISVVVPVYNSEDTIAACIESILSQFYADLELIIINDGSTDNSGTICDEYEKKDTRVHVYHQQNKGRTEARRVGVSHSTGEWLCFVDSDDTLPADSLQHLYQGVSDKTDIVLGNGYLLSKESRSMIPINEFRHLAVRGEGNIGLPWGSLYRRTLLTPYLFDIPRHIMMGEDYIFWLRLVFSTEKPVSIICESVYNKGDEHTCNTFQWTADYCYELNELRKSAIPEAQYNEYLPDILDDRLVNLYAVAASSPRREWKNSQYYQDIVSDMKLLNRKLPLSKRLFLMLPGMRKNLSWLFLLVVIVAMSCLELLDVFTLSDDILYRFVWQEDEASTPSIIHHLNDLVESQWVHYHVTNGRWVVHSIAQAFLAFAPPAVYQLLNAGLFGLMLYLASRLMVDKSHRLFSMVLMCFLLFVVFADIKTTMLWSMGTFNYLWVLVMTLVFLLYLRRIGHSKSHFHWFVSPLALFIGCSHEALSLPLSVTLVVYAFVELRKEGLYPRSLYILWYVVGTMICLFSPGIWNRADGEITLFNRLVSGGINIVFNLKLTWILVVTMLVTARFHAGNIMKAASLRPFYYLCLLLSLGIVVLCGTNLERVVFYTDFIAMLLLVELLCEKLSLRWQKRTMLACCLLMLVYFVPATMVRYENYSNYRHMEHQMSEEGREVVAVRCPVEGEQPVMDFFRRRFVNPTAEFGTYCSYMGFNAKDINMRDAAALYGKQQLVFLPEDVVQRIESDSTAYQHYELDKQQQLYIWQLKADQPVSKIVFNLKEEDLSSLSLPQRLLAYKDNTYILDDDFHYSVVHINGRHYLVFTRPTTNIYRRIDSIEYL